MKLFPWVGRPADTTHRTLAEAIAAETTARRQSTEVEAVADFVTRVARTIGRQP